MMIKACKDQLLQLCILIIALRYTLPQQLTYTLSKFQRFHPLHHTYIITNDQAPESAYHVLCLGTDGKTSDVLCFHYFFNASDVKAYGYHLANQIACCKQLRFE
jgi:hypothetical protein